MWTLLWGLRSQIGLGLIVLAVLGYIAVLKSDISTLTKTVVTLNAQLAEASVSLSMEKATSARLQGVLEKLSEEGKRRTANAAMWKGKFESSEKQWQGVVGGLTAFRPNPKETDCDAAIRLLHTAH